MFDGSHRSRRTINLGGGGRRRPRSITSNNTAAISGGTLVVEGVPDRKTQLLQSAKLQRERRRWLQKRNDAAATLQRHWRGYAARRQLARRDLLLLSRSANQQHDEMVRVLSLRLSPALVGFMTPQERLEAVLAYSTATATMAPLVATTTTTTTTTTTEHHHYAQSRILREALQLLRTGAKEAPMQQQQQQQLLGLITALFGSLISNNDASSSTAAALTTTTTTMQSLLLCAKEWLWQASSPNKALDVIPKTLLELSCRAAGANRKLLPLVAAILFGSHAHLLLEENGSYYWKADLQECCALLFGENNDAQACWNEELMEALMSILMVTGDNDAMDDDDDNDLIAVLPDTTTTTAYLVQSILHQREMILLSNAMTLLPMRNNNNNNNNTLTTVLPLLDFCLNRNSQLALLSSMVVARGENLTELWTRRCQNNKSPENDGSSSPTVAVDMSDDESEEDDDDAQHVTARDVNVPRPYYYRGPSQKYTRQQLQTLPKLDRLYQGDFWRLRRQSLASLDGMPQEERTALLDMATKLGDGSLMLSMGVAIFGNDKRSSSSNNHDIRNAYMNVLSILVQACTGIRTNAACPFLSRIAFHKEFVEEMWVHIRGKEEETPAYMAVFCDILSHQLLAMDDEEFLDCYTPANYKQGKLMAEEVILYLRSLLHEVYWSRPVVATDVRVPSSLTMTTTTTTVDTEALGKAQRARLLLSGTKLWNALYERWCRLVRSAPFCDEASWWFPRLVSRERDDDGAIVPGRDENDVEMEDNVRPMDLDDDDEDEEEMNVAVAAATLSSSAADQESDALADAFKDPKMARILTSIPQALPFERRVLLFSSLLDADKRKTQDESNAIRQMMMQLQNADMSEPEFTGREQVEIRRDAMYDDSMEQLNELGPKLKRKVQVTFINQHGAREAGIDGGGVFKEFLDDLIKEAFDPKKGSERLGGAPLFAVTPLQTLYVNLGAAQQSGNEVLAHYEFLGRVLGKAVYESILVEPQFCLPFLNQLLGKLNTLDDLKNMDPEYYRHLAALRKMSKSEIDSLGLTFELTTSVSGGLGRRTLELFPGGSSVPVTKDNVIRYVHLVAHQRMNIDGALQTKAFLRGFRDLIPASWVRLFSSYELQKLISGDDTVKGIDVRGMKLAMQYSGGYHPSQPIMRWFWEVVEEMTPVQQQKFLKFMTSCSRQPLLGFQALVPLPCVQQVRLHEAEGLSGRVRLPTSSTCMNLLKLPNYESKEILREKLLYAIDAGAGFELS